MAAGGAPRIELSGVGKEYRLGATPFFGRTLRDAVKEWTSFGRSSPGTFWALKDLCLSARSGDVLGVVGPNGSGKSTLLRILAGITTPTKGACDLQGRLACLLAVGTGLRGELTGRENILLQAALLGMSSRETADAYESIVRFSQIERFLSTPLRRFSSGMYVRLAFSVAAHCPSDIVLLDESLTHGDAAFQEKCLAHLESTAQEKITVFVSHDLAMLSRLCRRTVVLEGGRVAFAGPTTEAIEAYREVMAREASGVRS